MKKNKESCHYEENGFFFSNCKDKPIITYCDKCKTLFLVSSSGDKDELDLTIEELSKFIKNK